MCYAEDGKMATVGTMVELNSFELNEDGSMDVVRNIAYIHIITSPWAVCLREWLGENEASV